MKKKNLWLAVVTFVLCLGVMATGVYAVRTAMLKMGGTLGFNMNNCMVEVSGTISNIAVKDTQTGAFAKTTKTIQNAIMGGETETETKLELGQLDFYAGEDMIFELTFKNLGAKSIVGKFDIEFENTKVQVVQSSLYDSLPAQKVITPSGTTTLTFALTLTDESAVVDGFAFTITAGFEELEHEQGELYIENGRLYVEYGFYPTDEETVSIFTATGGRSDNTSMYGENRGKPIRWVAFSTDGTTALTNVTSIPTTGDLYFVSEYAFDKHVFNSVNDAPIQGKNPNDYAYSEIHTYLNSGFVSKYKLEGLVNAVEPRNLPSEDISSIVTDAEYPNGNKALDIDEQAKLWLLSTAENSLVTTVMGTNGNKGYYPSQTDQVYNANFTEYGADWWLRSPYADNYRHARYVNFVGIVDNNGVSGERALRPAFQINLG